MSESIRDLDSEGLRRLNSATQYPSILTYHALGERGRLLEDRTTDFTVDSSTIEVTEKIDGTNARVVVPPRSFGRPVIGSRTELLHCLGDVIANPAQGIVDAILLYAETMETVFSERNTVTVVFGEVYGGKVSSGSKNYSTTGTIGFRLFDVAMIPLDILDWEASRIANWREQSGQRFADVALRSEMTAAVGCETVPGLTAQPPPVSVAETHAWLTALLTDTRARLDNSGRGKAEGVVVRTSDRSQIAKIRFEDYERTAKVTRP